MLTVVDLPEPLGPRYQRTSPRRAVKLTSRIAAEAVAWPAGSAQQIRWRCRRRMRGQNRMPIMPKAAKLISV